MKLRRTPPDKRSDCLAGSSLYSRKVQSLKTLYSHKAWSLYKPYIHARFKVLKPYIHARFNVLKLLLYVKTLQQSGILTRKRVKTNKTKTYFETMGRFLGLRKYLYFFFRNLVSNMKRLLLYYFNHVTYPYT